jgi:hypothetical protein
MADARIELEKAQSENIDDSRQFTGASRRTERLAWMSGVILLALAAAGLAALALRSTPAAPEMRLEINTPGAVNPVAFAISPDGLKIVFAARSEGRLFLWLRSLDSGSVRPLPQTEDASAPFWSSDSRSVGFFANGKLKRIDIEGEATSVLATSTANLGGTWNRDGVILFSPTPNSPIFRVSSAGGEPSLATRFEPGTFESPRPAVSARWPSLSLLLILNWRPKSQ